MGDLLKFAAVVALGLAVAWTVRQFYGLFDNVYIAAAIWIPAMLAIGFIVDRRDSRRRQANKANSTLD
jgi:putative flippase GtrA